MLMIYNNHPSFFKAIVQVITIFTITNNLIYARIENYYLNVPDYLGN